MIYISSKDIEELNEEALKVFLQKKYRENRFLDYKLKYEKQSVDEAKEEFLADVTSFANHYGGNIIIGVEELEEEGASSQPGELIGIEEGNEAAEMYRNLCDTSIDPPVHGLVVKDLFLTNGKWAIVVYIPISLRRPHMVTFKGRNRFYIRRDDRTVKMTADEVKRTVLEVVSIEKNIEEYLKTVEEEVKEDFLQNDFSLFIHAVPYLIEEDQIDTVSEDIKSLLSSDKLHIEGIDLRSYSPMPNIHGLFGGSERTAPFFQVYVHRTGYIGLAFSAEKLLKVRGNEEKKVLYPSIRLVFLAFLRLSKLVTEKTGISAPYQIRVKFVNSIGVKYIYTDSFGFNYTADIIWKRPLLILPGVRVDNFKNVDGIADLFFERLRNAFGLP